MEYTTHVNRPPQCTLTIVAPSEETKSTSGITTPAPPVSPMCSVRNLRDSFNSANRKITDKNVEAVAKLDYEFNEGLLVGIGYAHKIRPPSYIERYLWIPLETNSGLGDMNNYVGNLALKPEQSNQVELHLEFNYEAGFFSPRIFYRDVKDYIQGEATTVTRWGANFRP